MRRWLRVAAMALCCGMAALPLCAQEQQQKPAAQKPTQETNPFPEDTNSVPVLPSSSNDAEAATPDAVDYGNVKLADPNVDPVRSPDDGSLAPAAGGSSSSSAGLDELLKAPDEPEKSGRRGKHARGDDEETPAQRAASPAEDEQVGAYYLETKNWKGALSRFESALVLDPENPDVYWGLGEAERHLGRFAEAKAHYRKLVEYDPDSKHGKEAKSLLKEPELANAPAVSQNAAPQK